MRHSVATPNRIDKHTLDQYTTTHLPVLQKLNSILCLTYTRLQFNPVTCQITPHLPKGWLSHPTNLYIYPKGPTLTLLHLGPVFQPCVGTGAYPSINHNCPDSFKNTLLQNQRKYYSPLLPHNFPDSTLFSTTPKPPLHGHFPIHPTLS